MCVLFIYLLFIHPDFERFVGLEIKLTMPIYFLHLSSSFISFRFDKLEKTFGMEVKRAREGVTGHF